jgi:hypothetical protein
VKAKAKVCGAKTKSGRPCAQTIIGRDGRCKSHPLEGKVPAAAGAGAPLGNQNAVTHGLYAKGLTVEEAARRAAGVFKPGSLDAELEILRVQLERTLEAYRSFIERPNDPQLMTLVEMTEEEGTGVPVWVNGIEKSDGRTSHTHKRRKRPDYVQHILRITGRITDLERIRKAQGFDAPPKPVGGVAPEALSPKELARRIAFILAKAQQAAA